jgi:hypothetical protein
MFKSIILLLVFLGMRPIFHIQNFKGNRLSAKIKVPVVNKGLVVKKRIYVLLVLKVILINWTTFLLSFIVLGLCAEEDTFVF